MNTMAQMKIEPELQIKSEKYDEFDDQTSAIETTFEPKIENKAEHFGVKMLRMVKVKIEPGSEPKIDKCADIDDKMCGMVEIKMEPGFEPKIDKSEDIADGMSGMVETKMEQGFEINVKTEKIISKTIDQPKWEIVVATNRWLQTEPFGSSVKGSPFVPFKMPFVGTHLQPCPPESRFDIGELLKTFPDIGLIVDLTDNLRTYQVSDLIAFGVDYVNIPVKLVPKNEVPNDELLKLFLYACSTYSAKNPDKLIGVHDLLGTRATGYMICKALETFGYSMQQGMRRFEMARGHSIDPVLGRVMNGRLDQWIPQSKLTPKMRRRIRVQKKKRRNIEWKAAIKRSYHWHQVKIEPKFERFAY